MLFVNKYFAETFENSEEHILLCLKKIRLNTTFLELEDNFISVCVCIFTSYASKIFRQNIPKPENYLRSFS